MLGSGEAMVGRGMQQNKNGRRRNGERRKENTQTPGGKIKEKEKRLSMMRRETEAVDRGWGEGEGNLDSS